MHASSAKELRLDSVRTNLANDQALLESVRSGDDAALRELLTRHAPAVFRFALKMCRNRQDAEDVAQETLLAAVRGAKDVRGTSSFTTWLYAVARSFCIKMRRRQKRTEGAVTEAPTDVRAREDDATARELGAALEAAIDALAPKYREVIVLRDIEGLSAAEVAEVLGTTVEAVKSRLHRARSEIRTSLGQLITSPSPTATSLEGPCAGIATTFSRYLEGEIGPEACATMQKHVDTCTSCATVCEGLRRTVSMCREAGNAPFSEELQAQVRSALEQALRRARQSGKPRPRPIS
jgi:RNA polymerase sigma-70 factor (ECF subfamily)